jgi:hypothetical protein
VHIGLLADWLSAGETTKSIYHLLVNNFDHRFSSGVAKAQLLAFKATKDMIPAIVEALITQLSNQAITTLPPDESHTNLKNLEGLQALIHVFPAASNTTESNAHGMIKGKSEHPPHTLCLPVLGSPSGQ